jgi:hypothetical protein
MSNTIVAVLFIVALVILGPITTIWCINTLFPVAAIPYTFDTWCATMILGGLFKTSVVNKKA